MSALLTLRWVPGTLETVRVRNRQDALLLSISGVQAVLGRPALDGLYLRGSFVFEDHEDEVAAVWFALSCLAEEEGYAAQSVPTGPLPWRGPTSARFDTRSAAD